MKGKLVTVFGGSGFLGRYVVQKLARLGVQIRVPVRDPDAALFLKPMGEIGQVTPIAVDVTSEESVTKAVTGSDMVVNLIGILYERGKQTFETCHVKAPTLISQAASVKGVKRLVHVSALGADLSSPSRYATTKAKGEERVRANFPKTTLIRPSVIFGPEDRFFNLFASLARFSPALPLVGGGQTKFQPVYVGDVAEAIVRTLQTPNDAHGGKTFELGGDKVYTFEEVMAFVLETTKRRRALIPIPFFVGSCVGKILQNFPNPLLTADQVKLLQKDNIIESKSSDFKTLDISPCSVEMLVPTYLKRYQYNG